MYAHTLNHVRLKITILTGNFSIQNFHFEVLHPRDMTHTSTLARRKIKWHQSKLRKEEWQIILFKKTTVSNVTRSRPERGDCSPSEMTKHKICHCPEGYIYSKNIQHLAILRLLFIHVSRYIVIVCRIIDRPHVVQINTIKPVILQKVQKLNIHSLDRCFFSNDGRIRCRHDIAVPDEILLVKRVLKQTLGRFRWYVLL